MFTNVYLSIQWLNLLFVVGRKKREREEDYKIADILSKEVSILQHEQHIFERFLFVFTLRI